MVAAWDARSSSRVDWSSDMALRKSVGCGIQKPLADVVICASGPKLFVELEGSWKLTGSPDPDLFDELAHSGRRLLSPPFIRHDELRHVGRAATYAGTR